VHLFASKVIAGDERTESLGEIINLLNSTSNPQVRDSPSIRHAAVVPLLGKLWPPFFDVLRLCVCVCVSVRRARRQTDSSTAPDDVIERSANLLCTSVFVPIGGIHHASHQEVVQRKGYRRYVMKRREPSWTWRK
jgi:hypothetical protein